MDGTVVSKNYTLPRHRSKVKQGKSDSSDNMYPWLFALTKYDVEYEGGAVEGGAGALPLLLVSPLLRLRGAASLLRGWLASDAPPSLFLCLQSLWRTLAQSRRHSVSSQAV